MLKTCLILVESTSLAYIESHGGLRSHHQLMHTGLIFIGSLALICWVIQFLPVISVPITAKQIGYSLHFASYNNYTFGVLGVCDTQRNVCSSPQIGYPNNDSFYYVVSGEDTPQEGFQTIQLPSSATHSISKLLVVHIVAFFFTSLLLVESAFIVALDLLDNGKPKWLLRRLGVQRSETRKRDITGYLSLMLLFSLLLFLLTLLAFLADILLFVPRLSSLGWIQLLPTLMMALIASLVCFMKRSIQSRRHLEDNYPAGDIWGKRALHNWVDDSASDDGIYIYSHGFTSHNDERFTAERNHVHENERHESEHRTADGACSPNRLARGRSDDYELHDMR